MVDRLARTVAFRRRSWSIAYLGTGARHLGNFSASVARARRLLPPSSTAHTAGAAIVQNSKRNPSRS